MVERRPEEASVVGSIPTSGTSFKIRLDIVNGVSYLRDSLI